MILRDYPLAWPASRTRTRSSLRTRARFFATTNRPSVVGGSTYIERRTRSLSESEDALEAELVRLGARNAVISSNLRLNQDGSISSRQSEPEDPGVAVFFDYKGQKMAFACDRWDRATDNLYAIAKTVEALRGIERWGSGEMVRAAFTGFRALPLPQRPWRQIFGFSENETPPLDVIEERYRIAVQQNHPDRGGLSIIMAEINAARDEARRELEG